MKVKSILVTQPKPESDKSPYFDLAKMYNLNIDFREFIHVEPVDVRTFLEDKINIKDYSAVIFTSRNAIDHFFRICNELFIHVPETFKYFCVSESTAYYLQKFVVYRRRKVFYSKDQNKSLIDVIKKNREERFLLPCSDLSKQDISDTLSKLKIKITKAYIYKTVCSDISDLANVNYDMLVFFSPLSVTSLFKNFPKFKQKETRIAAFGPTTCQAVIDAGLTLNIQAPIPGIPSMTMAIEQYIKKINKQL
ncbi:MAG: uroporphyrinogen-III synthase [Bacteroidota bacterium]